MSEARRLALVLSEPQYEAVMAAIRYTAATFELDGPASVGMGPHVPRSLAAAEARLMSAWSAPRGAHRHE